MNDKKSNVIVLLSGGIDSTGCVAYYLQQNFCVTGMFVDYGQAARKPEQNAALAISQYYNIALERISVSNTREWRAGCIPGRNAYLLFTALMNFRYRSGLVAIGVHAGTSYWDCSEEFIELMQKSFECYTDGRISVDAPFLKWNKQEVWDYCRTQKVPLKYTYSCELGKVQPCGECLSCKDLERLNAC